MVVMICGARLATADELHLGLVRDAHQRRWPHASAGRRLRTRVRRENDQHHVGVVAPAVTSQIIAGTKRRAAASLNKPPAPERQKFSLNFPTIVTVSPQIDPFSRHLQQVHLRGPPLPNPFRCHPIGVARGCTPGRRKRDTFTGASCRCTPTDRACTSRQSKSRFLKENLDIWTVGVVTLVVSACF